MSGAARPLATMSAAFTGSARGDWATPRELFDVLDDEFGFGLDAAANASNTCCASYLDEAADALGPAPWPISGGAVWLNPPYGRGMRDWLCRAVTEVHQRAVGPTCVVALIPARTDTIAWHEWVIPWAAEVRFVRGRVIFEGAAQGAPFPSAIVIYRRGDARCRVSTFAPRRAACAKAEVAR